MENLNLPPFYAGQKIVYITGRNMPINSTHTVISCAKNYCGTCWVVIIEAKPPVFSRERLAAATLVRCMGCKAVVPKSVYVNKRTGGWIAASFRPVQEQKMVKVNFVIRQTTIHFFCRSIF